MLLEALTELAAATVTAMNAPTSPSSPAPVRPITGTTIFHTHLRPARHWRTIPAFGPANSHSWRKRCTCTGGLPGHEHRQRMPLPPVRRRWAVRARQVRGEVGPGSARPRDGVRWLQNKMKPVARRSTVPMVVGKGKALGSGGDGWQERCRWARVG